MDAINQTSMSQIVNKGLLCSESVKAKMNGYFVASLDRFSTKSVWCLLHGSYHLYPGQLKNYLLTQTHLIELSRSTWTTQIDIRVYPNPMQETAQIILNNPGSERELTIIVQSILGKVCYSRTFELSTGSSAQEIRLDQRFADGVYLLKMYSEEDLIFHSKLIKDQ